jgi:DNA-binding transcriptional ArsR family regulator
MIEGEKVPLHHNIPPQQHIDEIADFFKVFGDSTRLKILFLLQYGELPVLSIAHALDMQQSTISQQLKLLRTTRLVKSRKEGRSIYYSLNDDHIQRILALGVEHYDELFKE